jgi:hypothetical protein
MILIRYLLICIIGYLIVRSFIKYGGEENASEGLHKTDDKASSKKISKKIGEFIDYEEVKKEKK